MESRKLSNLDERSLHGFTPSLRMYSREIITQEVFNEHRVRSIG